MNHPLKINYEGNLVEDIGNLRYDALAQLFAELSDKLEKDGDADFRRKRPQLAHALYSAAVCLDEARHEIERAWKISEPHMPT